MRDLLRRLSAAFGNLSSRERALVGGAAGMLGLAFVYVVISTLVLPIGERARLRRETAEQQLASMTRLRRDFDDVNSRVSAVERRIQRGPSGNLRTTLESLASKSLVKVESMEPQSSPADDRYRENKVEIALKGVTLPQVVNYLHQIESTPQVLSVKSLRIRNRTDKPELLDVIFTVSSFERI